MRVSFVIPAHDEERVIGPTIDALAHAGRVLGLDYEIVVACDACTDRTREVAERHGARTMEIDKRHIAATRNAGARAARGDVLIFVDADTHVPVATVAEALGAIGRGDVGGGAVFGFCRPLPWWAPPTEWLMQGIGRATQLTGGAFLFCTREALERAGGWDEGVFVSEEILLARELKKIGRFRIVRTPVVTSGRKLRTFTAREMFGLTMRAAVSPAMVTKREGLELWYGPRREDPAGAPAGRTAAPLP